MTLRQNAAFKEWQMSKFRDKVKEQEPYVDRWLTRLAASERSAEIIAVAAAIALGVGVVLWLIG